MKMQLSLFKPYTVESHRASKGTIFQVVTMSSTMSPGIKLTIKHFRNLIVKDENDKRRKTNSIRSACR